MKTKQNIPEQFLKPYNPKEQESEMLKLWEASGYANPDVCIEKGVTTPDADTFSIVLPPPNVTGVLHMGSALMIAIEDILVRTARMQGKRTLWIPGTDSAAIATQAKVEADIYKTEKKTRHDIGRETLLQRIEMFIEENKTTIITQIKKMGASLDWSRYAYTMDEKRVRAVTEAFVRMYKAGLIYRGLRIVHWDPKSQTTVSDDEIEYVEQTDPLYHLQYGPFVIATVRPETKFGDKYVVMHPNDERYKKYKHGETFEAEWINGPVTATVIKDEAADMTFGSGVMTITPAHSSIDFEIAERHNLTTLRVIDDKGLLFPIAGEFAGEHIKKARTRIVEKMKKKGLVVKVDEQYKHNVATNYRGGGTIEPQIKKQWFVGVNIPFESQKGAMTLKQWMKTVVENRDVQIIPEHFEKTYLHWIENLRDWCVSRQIWFGHQIPVWYRGEEIYCALEAPKESGWTRDSDVLDTWFSSSLWTFSTLGWPQQTKDLQTYHPTTILETGYDILPFWVARMILMSGFHLGHIPFKKVYLHGLVRDKEGRKISKSLGNNIDPLVMAEKYGMDAVRMSLIAGMAPGTDSTISEEKIRGYKHFANKIWNITRFILEHTDIESVKNDITLTETDKKILEEVRALTRDVTAHIENFRLDLAADILYHFVWNRLADELLEESKIIFAGGGNDAVSRRHTLYVILTTCIRLLHPFMPFVTEAVWQKLPKKDSDILMVARWNA